MSTTKTTGRYALVSADAWVAGLSGLAVMILLGSTALFLGVVLYEGGAHVDVAFLTGAPRADLTGGVFPALVGTVLLTLLMTLAGVPIGIATGIYLAEYAPRHSKLASLIRAAVQNLAGVPSIVFGLFGLGFFVMFVGRGLDTVTAQSEPLWGRPGLIWSSLTLAVLTLPVIIVATEEALRAVPEELRLASMALGATRFQTTFEVVLPQARRGILTGVILTVGRGAGEVAPILFTGVANYLPALPTDLRDMHMHLGYHVFALATQSPNVDAARPTLFASVLVLLVSTSLLNLAAILLRHRERRRHA